MLRMLWSCLRKEWRSLLDIKYEEDSFANVGSEDEKSALEKLFLKIPRYDDVNAQDVDGRLITDDLEFNANDDEIVSFVLCNFNNTPSLEKIEEPEEKISFDSGNLALHKWRNFAAKKESAQTKGFDQIFLKKTKKVFYVYPFTLFYFKVIFLLPS